MISDIWAVPTTTFLLANKFHHVQMLEWKMKESEHSFPSPIWKHKTEENSHAENCKRITNMAVAKIQDQYAGTFIKRMWDFQNVVAYQGRPGEPRLLKAITARPRSWQKLINFSCWKYGLASICKIRYNHYYKKLNCF